MFGIFEKKTNGELVDLVDAILKNDNGKEYYYTIAEAHAIDLIAKTISKCEVQTFLLDKENDIVKKKKGDLYWLLNLQPSLNENGTNFMYKLVVKLLAEGKALVLINNKTKNKNLYIAESYTTDNKIYLGKTFKNITVEDDEGNQLKIEKSYSIDEVIYYSLNNSMLRVASKNFKENSEKIIKIAWRKFVFANTQKWRLKNPGGQPKMIDAETGKDISYEDYKKKLLDGLFGEEDSITMLSEIFDLINLNKDTKVGTEDYEKLITQIGNTVAQIWNIPQDIFWGNKTEKSTGSNDFITYAVDPYFEILEDGFNISLVGKESYLKGEYVKFNRMNIGYKDLMDKASGWDKLISSGFSFNQLCEMLGLPVIDEEWANQHYITKNYANVKGGAEDEE